MKSDMLKGIITINASQLAFVLKMKKSDAEDMMTYCYLKVTPKEKQEKETPLRLNIEVIEKVKHIELRSALIDIRDKWMERNESRRWILDYPLKKFKTNESGMYPAYIKIPNPLASMLSEGVKQEIVDAWNKRHAEMICDGGIIGFKK